MDEAPAQIAGDAVGNLGARENVMDEKEEYGFIVVVWVRVICFIMEKYAWCDSLMLA